MRPEMKTEFADQLEKLFNEFSARFKDFKSHEHYLKYFLHHFTQTLTKPPWYPDGTDWSSRENWFEGQVCGNESWWFLPEISWPR